jgi:hypothetical protein
VKGDRELAMKFLRSIYIKLRRLVFV